LADPDVITNGSFEIGPDPGSYLTLPVGSTAITGWTVTRASIDYKGTYWQHSNGNRSLDLDDSPGFGGIAQTFDTNPGQTYIIRFDMAGNPDGPPVVKQMRVTAAGQQQDFSFDTTGHSRTNMGWTTRTWSFVANSTSSTLEFYSLDTVDGRYGPALDNVRLVPEPSPPLYTKSYYIESNDPQSALELGCSARVRGEQGLVVLDFGHPYILSSGAYGTQLPRSCDLFPACRYASRDEIKSITLTFADGYAHPARCLIPPPYPQPNLVIAIGADNSALLDAGGIWRDNRFLTFEQAQDWASMIIDVRNKLNDPGYAGVKAASGFDAEYYGSTIADCRNPITGRRGQCPNGDPPASFEAQKWTVYEVHGTTNNGTRYWSEGYDGVTGRERMYNFGSCEDCPRRDTPTIWRQNPITSTVLSRIYRLNWELGSAYPLPQNYFEPRSYEWYNVRWYTYDEFGRNMTVQGAMAQCGSSNCIDNDPGRRLQPRFDLACHPDVPCTGEWTDYNCGNNSCPNLPPSPGWQALTDMLSSPNRPDGTPNPALPTQTSLPYGVTDIFYQPTYP
jgi:choice-of-anchor C domain-containing protein